MNNPRRLLDAVIVGALLLAHVPGLADSMYPDAPGSPAALIAIAAPSQPIPNQPDQPDKHRAYPRQSASGL